MTPDEARALARLGGRAAAGLAGHVEIVHRTVAGRAFALTPPTPARPLHDAIAGLTYAAVKTGTRVAGYLAGEWLRARHGRRAVTAADPPAPLSAPALALLNAVAGHTLHADGDALAIRFAVRVGSRDVEPSARSLRAAFPDATARMAVFVHGFARTEASWRARDRPAFGDLLADRLGFTPVHLRYNTGRHISDSGADVAALLARLTGEWPVPLDDLVIVGHSMGGLVARAACHVGHRQEAAWVRQVRGVVYLGTPHTGAGLARVTRYAGRALAVFPETRGYGTALDSSPGLRDLRFGYVTEDDWRDCDSGTCLGDHAADTPLLPTAAHLAVAATIGSRADGLVARMLGDLLVVPASARGTHLRRPPLAFTSVAHHGRAHHIDLLHHPRVYELVESWLREVLDGPGALSRAARATVPGAGR